MQDEWCYPNKATPVGSSAYYSVRFAPPDLRDALALLFGWRAQLRDVPVQCSDPGVARLKLQWWREELGRAFEGEARHPLTRALSPVVRRWDLPGIPFLEVADAAEDEVRKQPAPDMERLEHSLDRDHGALFELLGRCHGITDPPAIQTLRRLGSFCALVYLIRDLGAMRRRHHDPLPRDWLANTGADPKDDYRKPLRRLAQRARELRRGETPNAAPPVVAVRVAILETLLTELERSDFPVLDRRVGLTPVRKLWIGWRASRRNRFGPMR
jgi:phytoene synthase